jgi:hypothetical protein
MARGSAAVAAAAVLALYLCLCLFASVGAADGGSSCSDAAADACGGPSHGTCQAGGVCDCVIGWARDPNCTVADSPVASGSAELKLAAGIMTNATFRARIAAIAGVMDPEQVSVASPRSSGPLSATIVVVVFGSDNATAAVTRLLSATAANDPAVGAAGILQVRAGSSAAVIFTPPTPSPPPVRDFGPLSPAVLASISIGATVGAVCILFGFVWYFRASAVCAPDITANYRHRSPV